MHIFRFRIDWTGPESTRIVHTCLPAYDFYLLYLGENVKRERIRCVEADNITFVFLVTVLASNYVVKSISVPARRARCLVQPFNGNRSGWTILKGGLTDLPKTLVKKMSKSFSHNLSHLRVDDNLLMRWWSWRPMLNTRRVVCFWRMWLWYWYNI